MYKNITILLLLTKLTKLDDLEIHGILVKANYKQISNNY